MFAPETREKLVAAVRAVAREEIVPRFRRLDPGQIEQKSGPADLVTVADRQAEARLAEAIGRFWPDAVVIGEEAVEAGQVSLGRLEGAEWAVVIDPIDGTWNFARGVAAFGILIAVVRRGRTIWGMLYDPLLDDWIEAQAGQGARMVQAQGSTRLRLSPAPAEGELVGFVPFNHLPAPRRAELVSALAAQMRVYDLRCSAHEYRLLAQGHVDFNLSFEGKPWDHLAGILAVTEAGGVSQRLDGTAYGLGTRSPGNPLISARSAAVWDEVAAVLQAVI